ncbi:NAD(P)H:quinone oxidoreductase, type IV [Chytridium lagenaria]|nr:NAD(P)H:quinone oxidoreductase, type IV [Chytridium lagenaria]
MAPKIYVIIYSSWGHIKTLGESIAKGAKEAGAEVKIFRVPETLPSEVTAKMHMASFDDIPVITPAELTEADGFLFGLPTRYGVPAAQIKTFWDSTGQLWMTQALAGKFAGCFTSTATQCGGQETTIMTFIPHLVHHGISFVPLGYSHPNLHDNTEVHGGGPWGSGTIAGGDGSRKPHEKELAVAHEQGKRFAQLLNKVTK